MVCSLSLLKLMDTVLVVLLRHYLILALAEIFTTIPQSSRESGPETSVLRLLDFPLNRTGK